MPVSNKSRILLFERFLLRNTDQAHCLSVPELIEAANRCGMHINCDTVKDDLETLRSAGDNIITVRTGHTLRYGIGTHPLSYHDIQVLADALSCASFISEEESQHLIHHLCQLVSIHQEKAIHSARILAPKSVSQVQVREAIQLIGEAIGKQQKVAFQYFEYNGYKERVVRHRGKEYLVSPYLIVFQENRYYLIGFSEERNRTVSFRLDRMIKLHMTQEHFVPSALFDPHDYLDRMTKMYSGEERRIEMLCHDDVMKNMIDKFGMDLMTHKVSDHYFLAEVDAQLSPPFFAWLFQYTGKIRIAGPSDVIQSYDMILQSALREAHRWNVD